MTDHAQLIHFYATRAEKLAAAKLAPADFAHLIRKLRSRRCRHQVALSAYKDAWDRTRTMSHAGPILMGPPQAIGPMRVFAAYPAFTREQIAASAARCNRMFRAMHRYTPGLAS